MNGARGSLPRMVGQIDVYRVPNNIENYRKILLGLIFL